MSYRPAIDSTGSYVEGSISVYTAAGAPEWYRDKADRPRTTS